MWAETTRPDREGDAFELKPSRANRARVSGRWAYVMLGGHRCYAAGVERARIWGGGAAALIALAILFVLLKRQPKEPEYHSGHEESTSGQTGAAGTATPPPANAEPHTAADAGRRALDRAAHAELQRRIHQALWSQSGQAPPSGASTPPPTAAALSPQYIQARIREDFRPMAIKCYEELLARVPDAGGRAVLEFTIVADENLGGVVEDSALGDGGTLTDPGFSTCLAESMSTVAFAPPPKGGKTTVRYPFLFSPSDEADAGPRP